MDYLSSDFRFSSLSLRDLLFARDQFHAHLMHKANVVGTAVGKYLVRNADPDDEARRSRQSEKVLRPPRTLENSRVRDYSWPCVIVFVSRWVAASDFGGGGEHGSSDFIPKTIYLEDGRSVPICVVLAPFVDGAPERIDPANVKYSDRGLSGGYPATVEVQGARHIATLGCLVSDGHTVYALTSRHVAGAPGQKVTTFLNGKQVTVGISSNKQLGRLPFEKVYATWPGKYIYVNIDVGLIELEDQTQWSPSLFGVGRLGPLADLSILNLSLNVIGCPVLAYGCVSGRLEGRIAALFYRYKSVAGFEFVADFLIGSRSDVPLATHPGDSGLVWVVESENPAHDRSPIAVQWGGAVFGRSDATSLPFALATNLSTVCRELEVDILRSRELADFNYWGAVGHYTIGALACTKVRQAGLLKLMMANQENISFKPEDIDSSVGDVTVPAFVPLADVPDKVWKKPKNAETPFGRRGPENPNHYADIDFDRNGKTLDDITPTAADLDVAKWAQWYHDNGFHAVSERGLLPFRVWQIYIHMVVSVKAGVAAESSASRKDAIAQYVAAAGVLAHYVGDASQPLHGSYLSDGDPFVDKNGDETEEILGHGKGLGAGVHGAYEDAMLDENSAQLLTRIEAALTKAKQLNLVEGGQRAGFETLELMRRAMKKIEPRALVDAYVSLREKGPKRDAPSGLFKLFAPGTVEVLTDGCRTLAMLWDSAWSEGEGEKIPKQALEKVGSDALRQIYENQEFVPSVALGQVSQYLEE